jgi:tripartite motif-containing protein 71
MKPRWAGRRSLFLAAISIGSLAIVSPAFARVSFTGASGWGVKDGAHDFELCTITCRAGLDGGGAGEFNSPSDVALDHTGDLYVVEHNGDRIDQLAELNSFTRAWGWGVSDGMSKFETCTTTCQTGIAGGGAGQLMFPQSITVDPSGEVFVGDFSNRIDEFSPSGAFLAAWGWGVLDGMSQPETCTATCQTGLPGGGAGQLSNPDGAAAHGGEIYVANAANNRIEEFSGGSTFIRAWGWGVSDGMSQFETCTSTCQTGIAGGGAGQLSTPDAITVDPSGHVYVADFDNNRIAEFSGSGTFIRAWGWGVRDGAHHPEICTTSCQAAVKGGGAGQLNAPFGVSVDRFGHVYVGDGTNERIDQFSSTGRFIKAWGWGVTNGMKQFQTCTTTCRQGRFGGGAGEFSDPGGLETHASGDVYVADFSNNRIDEFTVIPPQTTITSGPANGSRTHDRRPTFGFKSTPSGSSFQCKLDGGSFKPCTSPHTTATLSFGSHTIAVRATDKAKDTDPTSARRIFKVVR